MSHDAPDNPGGEAPLLNYAPGLHPPNIADKPDSHDCSRAAHLLVAYNGSTLPRHCILCGTAVDGSPVKLTFTWDSSFSVTRITTLQLRQSAHVHAYLCPAHRSRWSTARRYGTVGIIGSVGVMFAGLALVADSESSSVPRFTPLALSLVIGGFAACIIALFYFSLGSRTLWCTKIQEGYLYLEGASPEFLRQVPAASGGG